MDLHVGISKEENDLKTLKISQTIGRTGENNATKCLKLHKQKNAS